MILNLNNLNELGALVLLAFLSAALVLFVLQIHKGFQQSEIKPALEKNQELLDHGKISKEDFETINRGLKLL